MLGEWDLEGIDNEMLTKKIVTLIGGKVIDKAVRFIESIICQRLNGWVKGKVNFTKKFYSCWRELIIV